jgi:Ni/Fe-hydrogenase subunit HybB-like protein
MTSIPLVPERRWPIVVLGTLAFMAAILTVWRFATGLASISNINDAYPWGWWTGFFMTLIAFGSTGFTIGLLADVFGVHKFHAFVRPGVLMGLMFYLSYAVILVIELGRPWMGWIVFPPFTWQPHSALFEIALCASAYTLVLFAEFGKPVAIRYEWVRLGRIIGLIYLPVVVLGCALSHLHQSTLGTLFNIIPLKIDPRWWSDLLPIMFLLTAYAAGLSLIVMEHVLATHFMRRQTRVDLIAGLSKILAVILLVYLVVRIGDSLRRGLVPSMIDFGPLSVSLWVELIGGIVVPMVMFLLPEVRKSKWAMFCAASLVAGGVMLYRMNISVFAMEVKHWQTYVPAFGEIMTSFGTVAGFLILYILAVRHLPIHDEPPLEPEGGS